MLSNSGKITKNTIKTACNDDKNIKYYTIINGKKIEVEL